MKRKTAYLVINPRRGKNVAKLTDVLAVFSAAGWKTDTALKEFGGHPVQLARGAADAGYDLVIGYGGDGTLNQVVNGVMAAKRRLRAQDPEAVLVTYRFDALPRALRLAIPSTYDNALLEHGRKVTVVGVGPNAERKGGYVVAGATADKKTGESKPVAVRMDQRTTLVRSTGESLPLGFAAELPEGGVIVVEGKQTKRGVIRAKRVVVVA